MIEIKNQNNKKYMLYCDPCLTVAYSLEFDYKWQIVYFNLLFIWLRLIYVKEIKIHTLYLTSKVLNFY